jgi:hypothetical protein
MRTVQAQFVAGDRFDLDTLNHDNIDDRVSPQHRHREDSATTFQFEDQRRKLTIEEAAAVFRFGGGGKKSEVLFR